VPSPREKLELYWPHETPEGNLMCPLCLALVHMDNIYYHKEYHLKLLDRLDKIEYLLIENSKK